MARRISATARMEGASQAAGEPASIAMHAHKSNVSEQIVSNAEEVIGFGYVENFTYWPALLSRENVDRFVDKAEAEGSREKVAIAASLLINAVFYRRKLGAPYGISEDRIADAAVQLLGLCLRRRLVVPRSLVLVFEILHRVDRQGRDAYRKIDEGTKAPIIEALELNAGRKISVRKLAVRLGVTRRTVDL
jgi:hypothetical protein